MKNLGLIQMENISGEGKNRDCMVMGVLTAVSLPISFFTWGTATLGVVTTAVAMGCLDD